MRGRWHAAALVLLAACRLSDLTFYQPGGPDAAGGAGDDAGMTAMPDADAGPVGPTPPSCVGLQATCGTAADSCCTSLAVPGGTFFRDHDLAGDSLSGGTNYQATISSFRLDKYDVTVARFRAFVAAGMGTQAHPPDANAGAHAKNAGSGWDASWNTSLDATTAELMADLQGSSDSTWHSDLPGNADDENRPMNYITWYEAMAFCIWDGGYLPTEAEWDYAAQGGAEQRAYPWSSPPGSLTIDASHVSYSPDGTNCTGDGMPGCAVTDIVPVGTLPNGNGRWGHADLAGNLYQWLLDWYGTYSATCTDCADLTMPPGPSPGRATRGGAFVYPKDNLRGGARSLGYPTMRNYVYGFRCARPM